MSRLKTFRQARVIIILIRLIKVFLDVAAKCQSNLFRNLHTSPDGKSYKIRFMRHIENPPNPYHKFSAEFLGEPPQAKLEIFEETATRKIITKNNSPDVGFDFSVNCYQKANY